MPRAIALFEKIIENSDKINSIKRDKAELLYQIAANSKSAVISRRALDIFLKQATYPGF
jgi:hypothetical protein